MTLKRKLSLAVVLVVVVVVVRTVLVAVRPQPAAVSFVRYGSNAVVLRITNLTDSPLTCDITVYHGYATGSNAFSFIILNAHQIAEAPFSMLITNSVPTRAQIHCTPQKDSILRWLFDIVGVHLSDPEYEMTIALPPPP